METNNEMIDDEINLPSIEDINNSIHFMKDFKKKLTLKKTTDARNNMLKEFDNEDKSALLDLEIQDDNICENCKSHNIIQLDGFLTCRDCSIQNSIVIDSGQEWRFYGADDNKGTDPSRCGLPTSDLLPNTSIGSMMSISGFETYKMKKLRNMQSWSSISYQDNKLLSSFNNISAVATNAGISQYIIEESKNMYKKVYLMKSCKRIKLDAMKAASVLWACKIKGVPRDTLEIAQMFNISIRDMRRGSKLFEEVWNSIVIKELEELEKNNMDAAASTAAATTAAAAISLENSNSSISQKPNTSTIKKTKKKSNIPSTLQSIEIENEMSFNNVIELQNEDRIKKEIKDTTEADIKNDNDERILELHGSSLKPSNSTDYLHRSCSKLELPEEIYNICKSICNYTEANDMLIKHIPVSRTAGCIYFVCFHLNIPITFLDISKICDISEVTVKKCYQKINKFTDELLLNTEISRYIKS